MLEECNSVFLEEEGEVEEGEERLDPLDLDLLDLDPLDLQDQYAQHYFLNKLFAMIVILPVAIESKMNF